MFCQYQPLYSVLFDISFLSSFILSTIGGEHSTAHSSADRRCHPWMIFPLLQLTAVSLRFFVCTLCLSSAIRVGHAGHMIGKYFLTSLHICAIVLVGK